MPDPKPDPMTPLVEWIAALIASAPGIVAIGMTANQPQVGTLLELGFAWLAGVGGAKLFTSGTFPTSNPPFLTVASFFGSTFANFVSAYWARFAPKQSGASLRFHLTLGFVAGLAFSALLCPLFPVWSVRLAGLLLGATGGIVFAMLRFFMLK